MKIQLPGMVLSLLLVVAGCSDSMGQTDASPGDGTPGSEKTPVGDGPIKQKDTGPPPPTTLPTFVQLDWNAFPKDRGPDYKVSGKTWVVKKSGSNGNPGTDSKPFLTINRAISAAQSGDLIRVHAGSYAEGKSGDFRGLIMGRSNVILTAAKGEKVTVTPLSSGFKYGCLMGANNITLNGINFSGFRYSVQVGFENSTQKGVVISNLTLQGSGSGIDEGINAYFDTTSKGFATIDGLLIKNVKVLGMGMGISCNTGICKGWRLENVKVVGAGGSGSGADAIAIESGENMLFYKVEVSGVAGDGIDTKAKKVVVWDSHVHHVKRNGIKLWYGGDIVNTLVHNTGADASIVTEYGPRVRLLHSVVAYHNKGGLSGYNMTFGYDSQGAQTVEIINSIIYNTAGGGYVNSKSTLKIKNSLFFGMDNGNVIEKGGSPVTLSQGAGAIKTRGWGDGNIFASPNLSSTFHLQSGSPAIGKGTVLSAEYPKTDATGKPRIKSGKPDLGPFEDF